MAKVNFESLKGETAAILASGLNLAELLTTYIINPEYYATSKILD